VGAPVSSLIQSGKTIESKKKNNTHHDLRDAKKPSGISAAAGTDAAADDDVDMIEIKARLRAKIAARFGLVRETLEGRRVDSGLSARL
jgi:hypothetical protein